MALEKEEFYFLCATSTRAHTHAAVPGRPGDENHHSVNPLKLRWGGGARAECRPPALLNTPSTLLPCLFDLCVYTIKEVVGEHELLTHRSPSSSSPVEIRTHSSLRPTTVFCMASSTAFLLLVAALHVCCCHAQGGDDGAVSAIYSLGDSITDTGNLVKQAPPGAFETIKHLPYGVTFGHPTGRCSDGLLMIDFLGTYTLQLQCSSSSQLHALVQSEKKWYCP